VEAGITNDGVAEAAPQWSEWQELMSGASWSPAWRQAGTFALTVLEEELGRGWPSLAWEKHDRQDLPPELAWSSAHAIAYAQLLELGLRLRLLEHHHGMAKVTRVLRSDPRPEQLTHIRLQLELAALAIRANADVTLEEIVTGASTPADVVIDLDGQALAFETFAVLRDKQSQDTQRYTDEVFDRLMAIKLHHGVDISGQFGHLDRPTTEAMLQTADTYARLVAAGGVAPPIHGAEFELEISKGGPAHLRGPASGGDLWSRLARRLEQKSEQAETAGANWLRVDVRDGLWQFTPWAQMDLADKAQKLGDAIRARLTHQTHLGGVVLSSGAVFAQGRFANEEIKVDGVLALRRLLPQLRVRETIIVPLRRSPAANLLAALYGEEPGWLDWALADLDLPSTAEIFVTVGSALGNGA
jgi:hypothetical protein